MNKFQFSAIAYVLKFALPKVSDLWRSFYLLIFRLRSPNPPVAF